MIEAGFWGFSSESAAPSGKKTRSLYPPGAVGDTGIGSLRSDKTNGKEKSGLGKLGFDW